MTTVYDPNSPDEQLVPLPSAPLTTLAPSIVLQPPLSRRGTGPGVVVFLPEHVDLSTEATKPLDPEPITKWAEEGFAVVGITAFEGLSVEQSLKQGVDALEALEQVDIKDKFAVIVYDSKLIYTVSEAVTKDPRVTVFVGYGSFPSPSCVIPILLHLTSNAPRPRNAPTALTTQHSYRTTSTTFVLPQAAKYDPGHAALAHSRTLVFLRKSLGGPLFDLEAIWDEHTFFEFQERSVAKTMGTMVAEPYVNHIPTMTGGVGRENLTAFYRDHFIFSNPADAQLQVVSRTVGSDRVVDEFVYHLTHDRTVDWLLPGVPATGKKLAIPMLAVVNIRGDRLYNEHIWWDQATALSQAGVLPSHLPFTDPQAAEGARPSLLRLPVAGVESALMLIDESKGKSNEMFGPGWGIQATSGSAPSETK
ncbi:hypothetical protein GALMADRAFT_235649 [Galerina marginata CBS 339.88]|uniref:SnoaL-like domain-containing protein n=1 Tax=Galerina marginata (strain CBS 339.88) TaxID=685588 RepID=A0A067TJW3_GALM3|nr:hypothetical protein GALMADRAFT_235649 [Galerina marginata CBS 339.88]